MTPSAGAAFRALTPLSSRFRPAPPVFSTPLFLEVPSLPRTLSPFGHPQRHLAPLPPLPSPSRRSSPHSTTPSRRCWPLAIPFWRSLSFLSFSASVLDSPLFYAALRSFTRLPVRFGHSPLILSTVILIASHLPFLPLSFRHFPPHSAAPRRFPPHPHYYYSNYTRRVFSTTRLLLASGFPSHPFHLFPPLLFLLAPLRPFPSIPIFSTDLRPFPHSSAIYFHSHSNISKCTYIQPRPSLLHLVPLPFHVLCDIC